MDHQRTQQVRLPQLVVVDEPHSASEGFRQLKARVTRRKGPGTTRTSEVRPLPEGRNRKVPMAQADLYTRPQDCRKLPFEPATIRTRERTMPLHRGGWPSRMTSTSALARRCTTRTSTSSARQLSSFPQLDARHDPIADQERTNHD